MAFPLAAPGSGRKSALAGFAVALAALFASLPYAAVAQVLYGSLTGSIVDVSGNALRNLQTLARLSPPQPRTPMEASRR